MSRTNTQGQGRGQIFEDKDEDKILASRQTCPRGLNIIGFQWCSKLVITMRWVAEIVRHWVPGHRADNRRCPTAEHAVMIIVERWACRPSGWQSEDTDCMLATSEIGVQQSTRYWGACFDLKIPVNGHSKPILDTFRNVQPMQLTVA